jgi:4-hydroxy-3-methylbut-2-enyl diphosphate reductase
VVVRGDAAGGSSSSSSAPATASEQSEQQFDSKAFRKTLTRSENYNKTGFGHKKEMLLQMEEEYTSE